MKSFFKIAGVFILLSVILSCLAGCSNSGTTNQAIAPKTENVNSAAVENNSKESADNDFPAVAADIMQAELKSPDGQSFKLEDYKGKVVLVNFWATWCGPCRAEMPELVKLREQHKDKGFEIIGVNADPGDSLEAIQAFGEKMNLTYRLAQSELSFFDQFLKISKFEGIPQSFLIDGDGKLRGVFLGGGQNTLNKLKDNVNKVMGAS